MKRLFKKSQKVVKGTSSAIVLSILIHAGLFLLAGLLVVFTILPEKEGIIFDNTPPVKVPKIPVKKLPMKTKKPSKQKATAKLTAVVNKPDLHEISFPDQPSSGMGTGFGGGLEGVVETFDILDELEEPTFFGDRQPIGNDFTGTLYDLKRRRNGGFRGLDNAEFWPLAGKFVRKGWDTSVLATYYKVPTKLYATCFMIPPMLSSLAPSAFNEPDMEGFMWLVHYKGQLVYPEPIKFRFWGSSDDVLIVRVDGKIVLNAPYHGSAAIDQNKDSWFDDGTKYPEGNRVYQMGMTRAAVGEWITLEASTPLDMEVLIGEEKGSTFSAMLCVEVDGVEYEKNNWGGPILPMFKTEEPSRDLIDVIHYNLYPGDACVTNGPVFRDY